MNQGQRIRQFHRLMAESLDYSILLEGMAPHPEQGLCTVSNNPNVNQWALMGFGRRQSISLTGHQLTLNHEQPITIQTRQALFRHLRNMNAQCKRYADPTQVHLPFQGGLMGFMGYEFGQWCDPALVHLFQKTAPRNTPDLLLIECDHWVIINRVSETFHALSPDPQWTIIAKDKWNDLQTPSPKSQPTSSLPTLTSDYLKTYETSLSPKAFEHGVNTIQQAILSGDLYQANLTFRLTKSLHIDPFSVYDSLSWHNPSPFSGMFRWPGGILLSNSPERLVNVYHQQVSIRPIAGTRGRGKTASDDKRIGQELLNNEKERAEHLMLVDLGRNDLGRICAPGSVIVDEQLTLERYSHVTHLISNITGKLAQGKDIWDVVQGTFPGGTITGCPKIRCMETLSNLEPVGRGLYTGGLGYWDARQTQMDMNILIRSLFLEETRTPFVYNGAIHVGAGIVADSVGTHEYRECLRKAATILGVLQYHEQHQHPAIH